MVGLRDHLPDLGLSGRLKWCAMTNKPEHMSESRFWDWLGKEFSKARAEHGELFARRTDTGIEILGPPASVDKFYELAEIAAKRLGFTGTREEAALYWCNRVGWKRINS